MWINFSFLLISTTVPLPNFLCMTVLSTPIDSNFVSKSCIVCDSGGGLPAKQSGRDFAIILASLSDLGYTVEWRVINAADYGMPQRRRRTYILGYLENSNVFHKIEDPNEWMLYDGVMAKAFPFEAKKDTLSVFKIDGSIKDISDKFNKNTKESPFGDAGIISQRNVYSVDTIPNYSGTTITLGDNIVDESLIPEEFFITPEELPKWEYEKGAKKIERTTKTDLNISFRKVERHSPITSNVLLVP